MQIHHLRRARALALILAAAALGGCAPAARGASASLDRGHRGARGPSAVSAASLDDATRARARRLWERAEELRARDRIVAVQLYVLADAEVGSEAGEGLHRRRRHLEEETARWRAESIAAYRALCDAPDLRGAPERPAALFALARSLQDAGNGEAAAERYRQFVEEHPDAPDAAEAHLALANLAFAEGDAGEAAFRCEAALRRSPEPGPRKRALYLKSWSLRELGRGRARAAMEALREIVRMPPGAPGSLDARLDEAAARELVSLYASYGDPDEADAFFAAAGSAGPELLAAAKARGLGSGRRLERLDRRIY